MVGGPRKTEKEMTHAMGGAREPMLGLVLSTLNCQQLKLRSRVLPHKQSLEEIYGPTTSAKSRADCSHSFGAQGCHLVAICSGPSLVSGCAQKCVFWKSLHI